jgi:hypothetical protein
MFWAGTTPRLVIKDPEMMKRNLVEQARSLPKATIKPSYSYFDQGTDNFRG